MSRLLLRYSTAVLVVLIASEAASGAVVMKAVGGEVSFLLDKPLPPPVSSICWKHKNSDGVVVKAIEWDEEDSFSIPNPRFKGITTLDNNTGQITITDLKVEHSGVYTIEINSKPLEQNFNLIIKEPVPKPEIKIELTSNPDVVYLRCEYSETIIWKNSAGETLKGSPTTKGESITVEKNGHPKNFYTCTLDNGASSETSDRVYERDLFSGSGSGSGEIVGIVFGIILLIIAIIIAAVILYKRNKNVKERVDEVFPCIKGQYTPANTGAEMTEDNGKQVNPSSPTTDKPNADVENPNPSPTTDKPNTDVENPNPSPTTDNTNADGKNSNPGQAC